LSEHIQQTAQMNDRPLGSSAPPGSGKSLIWNSTTNDHPLVDLANSGSTFPMASPIFGIAECKVRLLLAAYDIPLPPTTYKPCSRASYSLKLILPISTLLSLSRLSYAARASQVAVHWRWEWWSDQSRPENSRTPSKFIRAAKSAW
jgi:hypothetical protein